MKTRYRVCRGRRAVQSPRVAAPWAINGQGRPRVFRVACSVLRIFEPDEDSVKLEFQGFSGIFSTSGYDGGVSIEKFPISGRDIRRPGGSIRRDCRICRNCREWTHSLPLVRPSRACGFAHIPFAAPQAAQVECLRPFFYFYESYP